MAVVNGCNIPEDLLYDALVNDDPYGQGWIAKIKPTNPEEINLLLKGQAAVDALTKVANEKGIKCG